MGFGFTIGQKAAPADTSPTTRAAEDTMIAIRLSLFAWALASSLTRIDRAIRTVSHVAGNSEAPLRGDT